MGLLKDKRERTLRIADEHGADNDRQRLLDGQGAIERIDPNNG